MAVSKAAPMPAQATAKEAPGAAKGNAAPAGENPAAAKKSGKKRILVIAVAAVLLGGGAGAYFFLIAPKAEKAAQGADGAKGAGDEKDKKSELDRPFFVEFEAFTTNLRDPEKFLQIKLTFQVKTDKAAESLKDLGPIVRSAVIPVLSMQDAAALMTPEGKDKLGTDLAEAVNKSLTANGIADQVQAVLITHMLIQ